MVARLSIRIGALSACLVSACVAAGSAGAAPAWGTVANPQGTAPATPGSVWGSTGAPPAASKALIGCPPEARIKVYVNGSCLGAADAVRSGDAIPVQTDVEVSSHIKTNTLRGQNHSEGIVFRDGVPAPIRNWFTQARGGPGAAMTLEMWESGQLLEQVSLQNAVPDNETNSNGEDVLWVDYFQATETHPSQTSSTGQGSAGGLTSQPYGR